MNLIKKIVSVIVFLSCSGLCSGADSQSYINWPQDVAWEALTNNLNSCYGALVEKYRMADESTNLVHTPTYIWPFYDYLEFVHDTEYLLKKQVFVLSQTNGAPVDYDAYFATPLGPSDNGYIEGEIIYPAAFLKWNITNILQEAGYANWATNCVLSSWMLCDHTIQTQLVEVLNLLEWTSVGAAPFLTDDGIAGVGSGYGYSWSEVASGWEWVAYVYDFWEPYNGAGWPSAYAEQDTSVSWNLEDTHLEDVQSMTWSYYNDDDQWYGVLPLSNAISGNVFTKWDYLVDISFEGEYDVIDGSWNVSLMQMMFDQSPFPYLDSWVIIDAYDPDLPLGWSTNILSTNISGNKDLSIGCFVYVTRPTLGSYTTQTHTASVRVSEMTWRGSGLWSTKNQSYIGFTKTVSSDLESQKELYLKGAMPLYASFVEEYNEPKIPFEWAPLIDPLYSNHYARIYSVSDMLSNAVYDGACQATNMPPYSDTAPFFKGYAVEAGMWLVKWRIDDLPIPEGDSHVLRLADSGRDGIVDIGVDVSGLDGGTGTIFFDARVRKPLVTIPIASSYTWWPLPVHAYISQGAFDYLPYQYLVKGVLDENDGPYQSMSLSTRIVEKVVVTNATEHIKRISVLRPRGNIVEFDFPWLETEFGTNGYPIGINSNQTFVLKDFTTSGGGYYYLMFESGVVHKYRKLGNLVEVNSVEGSVSEILDYPDWEISEAGFDPDAVDCPGWDYYNEWNPDMGFNDFLVCCPGFILGWHFPDTDSDFDDAPERSYYGNYLTTWSREKGVIDDINYKSSGTGIIVTDITYDPDKRITGLTKSGLQGIEIGNVSISPEGTGIIYSWGTMTRAQSAPDTEPRTVTLTTTYNDIPGNLVREFDYDSLGRITEQRLVSDNSMAVTKYTYMADVSNRFINGALKSAKIQSIEYPGGSKISYGYAGDTGWLIAETNVVGNGSVAVAEYTYEKHAGDIYGSEPDLTRLVERPRSIIRKTDNLVTAKTLYSYSGGYSTRIQQCKSLEAGWGNTNNLSNNYYYNSYYYPYGGLPYQIVTPLGNILYSYSTSTGSIATVETHYNGQTAERIVNSLGNIVKAFTFENGEITSWADSGVNMDAFGRILRTDYLDGTYTQNSQYDLYGPREVRNIDGSITVRDYYADGWLKSVTNAALDQSTEYEYDPMGNVVQETFRSGHDTIITQTQYDLRGRVVFSKVGNKPSVTYTYTDKPYGTEVVIHSSGQGEGDIIEERYFNGKLKKIDGPGSPVKLEYEYDIDEGGYFEKEINTDNPKEWSKAYYNLLGDVAKVEQSKNEIDVMTSVYDYDQYARLVAVNDPVGISCRQTYNDKNQIEYTGVDENRNDLLESSSDDRMTHTVRDVGSEGFANISSIYPVAGSGAEIGFATNILSLDGKIMTSSVAGRTTTLMRSNYSGAGSYSVTNFAENGTMIIAEYDKWRLDRVEKFSKGVPRVLLEREDYRYYDIGLLDEIINSRTGSTKYKYDDLWRLSEIIPSDPFKESVTLDYWGDTDRVRFVKSSDGRQVLREYYPNGLLKRVSGDTAVDVAVEYDEQARCKKMITARDGQAVVTEIVRNQYTGLPVEKRINGQVLESYTWRDNGQISSVTVPANPANIVVSFDYNNAGDKIGNTYSDGTTTINQFVNRLGQVTNEAVVGGVSESYEKSTDGLLLFETVNGNGVIPDAQLGYKYIAGTGIRSQSICIADHMMVQSSKYYYDNNMRLSDLTNGWVGVGYLYETNSTSVTGITVKVSGNDVITRRIERDQHSNRPKRMICEADGQILQSMDYEYEPDSDRVSRIEFADGSWWQYTYDAQSRIAEGRLFNADGIVIPGMQFGYQYDEMGNVLDGGPLFDGINPAYRFEANNLNLHVTRCWDNKVEIMGRAATNAVVTVNGLPTARQGNSFSIIMTIDNSLASVVTNITITAVLFDGIKDVVAESTGKLFVPKADETVAHLLRGAVDNDSRFDFDFNGRDQIVSVKSVNTDQDFRLACDYYPDGRRARKMVYDSAVGGNLIRTCFYYYDRWNLVYEKIIEGSYVTHKRYNWGLDLEGQRTGEFGQAAGGIGGLLSIRETSATATNVYIPINDHNGNIVHLVDASTKDIAATYIYSPFGVLIGESGPAKDACPFRFQSKYYDQETELYYFGYRYYDPRSMKWLSNDPLKEQGGINMSAFCSNDPVNNVDPLGLASLDAHMAIALDAAGKREHSYKFRAAARAAAVQPDVPIPALNKTAYLPIPFRKSYLGCKYSIKLTIVSPAGEIRQGMSDVKESAGDWCDSVNERLWVLLPGGDSVVWFKHWWQDNSIKGSSAILGARIPGIRNIDIVRTHAGNLSFQHAMCWEGGPETAESMRDFIVDYLMERAQEYRSAVLSNNDELAGRIFGIASHTLVDSFTESHVGRNEAGMISGFYDYSLQSTELHDRQDNIILGSTKHKAVVAQTVSFLTALDVYANASRPETREQARQVQNSLRSSLMRFFQLDESPHMFISGEGLGKR